MGAGGRNKFQFVYYFISYDDYIVFLLTDKQLHVPAISGQSTRDSKEQIGELIK